MSNLAVANQYAKALLEIVAHPERAITRGQAAQEVAILHRLQGFTSEQALAQLEQFTAVLKESQELRTALLSPAITIGPKQKVIGKIGTQLGFAGYVKNFLVVVTRHRRLNLLGEICERFEALLDESQGLLRASVATAWPLDENGQAALTAALSQVTGKQVRCGYEVDAALVGGVAVRVGSTMYDGSVRGQLNGLRRRLSQ